jgi:small-conductance mechanosensitive channel
VVVKAPSVAEAAPSAKAPSVAEAAPSAPAPSVTEAAPPAPAPRAPEVVTPVQVPPASELVTQREAPVIALNRPITTLRGRLLGIDPAERARRASARVSDLLEREGPRHVSVLRQPQGNVLLIDDALAFALTPDDPDKLDGETLEEATESALQALNRIAAETREAHNRNRLLHALGRAGIATLALIAAIFVVLRARRALVRPLTRLLKERASHVQSAAGSVLHISRLFAFSRWLVHAFGSGLLLVLAYQWASYSLNQFPYTRPWGEKLDAYLLGIALGILSSILHALPDLLVAVVIFFLARGLIGLGRPFFDNIERNRVDLGWLDPETARATRRIFGLLVWTFAVVMAYPYLPGSGSEAFKGVTVLFGLMATLGGSSLFGQAASGLILMYSRTLRVGEYVRIGEQEGTVTELGTFTTRIRTGLGEELTLPNALVLGTVTKNYSRPTKGHGFYLDTTVTIGYDAPWRQVQALLIEGALRTPGIVHTPPPRVFATALSDFYVEYRLVCQCTHESPRSRAHALHELHAAVLDTFNEHGVQIMSPHYLGDPAERKVVPKASWYAEPATPPPVAPAKGGRARPVDD